MSQESTLLWGGFTASIVREHDFLGLAEGLEGTYFAIDSCLLVKDGRLVGLVERQDIISAIADKA